MPSGNVFTHLFNSLVTCNMMYYAMNMKNQYLDNMSDPVTQFIFQGLAGCVVKKESEVEFVEPDIRSKTMVMGLKKLDLLGYDAV